jgi:hypothetical protein
MVCVCNFNTSLNRFSNIFKHPIFKTNPWISFSHFFAGIINPTEAVPQLLLALKILLIFGFKALFVFLFLPIWDCWTDSIVLKIKYTLMLGRLWFSL